MLVHGVLSLYKCFGYIDIVYKMLHMSIYAVIIGLCMIIGLCVRLMVAKMRHTKLLVRRDICGVGIGGVGMNGKKGEQLMNTVSWTKMHINKWVVYTSLYWIAAQTQKNSDRERTGGDNNMGAWSDLHKAFNGKAQPRNRETNKSRSIEGKYVC